MVTNICNSWLKSGWKIIMQIVNAALSEDNQILVRICVQITDTIMMGPNLDSLIEVHWDLIQALVKLTKNSHLPTVIKAIQHLYKLVYHIASNTQKKDYKKILDCNNKIFMLLFRNMDVSTIFSFYSLLGFKNRSTIGEC